MFSLIITIIAITLVAALALATLYYGGSSYASGQARADAAKYATQGQQLLGASEMFKATVGRYPNSIQELVDASYLKAIPTANAPVDGPTGFPSAYAAGENAWTQPVAGEATFKLAPLAALQTCKELNRAAFGVDGVYKKAYQTYATQCYGESAEALTIVVTKNPGQLAAVLNPLTPGEVSTDAPPTDTSGSGPSSPWLSTPGTGSSPPAPSSSTSAVIDGGTVAFGDVPVGTYSDRTFTVRNTGAEAILLHSSYVYLSAANAGFVVLPNQGTCGATLQTNDTCTMVARFQPTAEALATTNIALVGSQYVFGQFTGRGVTAAGQVDTSFGLRVSAPGMVGNTIFISKAQNTSLASSYVEVTLTNITANPIDLGYKGSSIERPNRSYYLNLLRQSCADILPAGQSCVMRYYVNTEDVGAGDADELLRVRPGYGPNDSADFTVNLTVTTSSNPRPSAVTCYVGNSDAALLCDAATMRVLSGSKVGEIGVASTNSGGGLGGLGGGPIGGLGGL